MRLRLLTLLCPLLLLGLCWPLHAQENTAPTTRPEIKFGWDSKADAFKLEINIDKSIEVKPATSAEIPGLIAQLAIDDAACAVAAKRLSISGDVVIKPLGETLKSSNPKQCLFAALLLIARNTPAAQKALHAMPTANLVQGLQSDDDSVKGMSASLLAIVGSEKEVELLRAKINEGTDCLLINATLMGAALGHRKSLLTEIEPCLRSANPETRMMAAMVYRMVYPDKAVDKLLAMLPDPLSPVRGMVMLMLADQHTTRVNDAALTLLLFDPEASVRAVAAVAISPAENPGVIPYLIRASHDTSEDVRMACAAKLGECKRSLPIIEALVTLKSDPSQKVKDAAKDALEKLEKVKK